MDRYLFIDLKYAIDAHDMADMPGIAVNRFGLFCQAVDIKP